MALPADGVYAGWYLRPDGERRAAAISLGRRPTFYLEEELSLLEAYILDFEGDLYGEEARVEFVAHLRGQAKFESPQALSEQMARDVATTRHVLAWAPRDDRWGDDRWGDDRWGDDRQARTISGARTISPDRFEAACGPA